MNSNNNNNLQTYKDEVVLTEIIKPIKRHFWLIMFTSVLVAITTTVYLSLLSPTYRATALLQINNVEPYNELMSKKKGSVASDKKTQFQLMRSREFIKDVVLKFNLTENVAFNLGKFKEPYLSDEKNMVEVSIDSAISRLLAGLEITPITGTELVSLSFTSYNAELSIKLANHIGQTYANYQNNLRSTTQKKNNQWLFDKLDKLRSALDTSETNLQLFREKEGVVDIFGSVGLISNEISQISSAIIKVEQKIDQLKIKVDFTNKHQYDINVLSSLPEIYNNTQFIKLTNLEELLSIKLTQRFGPKHPELISLRGDLLSTKNRIQVQVNESVERIQGDYLVALDELKTLNMRLLKAKGKYLSLSGLRNQFSQLYREVETNKELFNIYLLKAKEVDILGSNDQNFNVSLIDKALSAKAQMLHKKNLFISLAFITSFLFFSSVLIFKELMSDTLNSSHKVDAFIDTDILGILPKIKVLGKSKVEKVSIDVHFNEAISSLRASLLFNRKEIAPQIIAVTSSDSGEGKSTIALQLARSFSQLEKVLLIEADLRNPSLADNLKLYANRPGLSNLLAKTHSSEACIIKGYERQLDILTSGVTPSNPLMFLSMKRFERLMNDFSGNYDRIIIETPPVNVVSDALIISKLVDSVIYVVNSGKTKKESVLAGLNTLKHANAPVDGIVLNQSEFIDKKIYQNKYYKKKAKNIKLALRKVVS